MKYKIVHQKYNKLRDFDNVIINLFHLILNRNHINEYDESVKGINYITVFVKNFQESYNLFKSIIKPDDIKFMKFLMDFVKSNKMGYKPQYQSLFYHYNDYTKLDNIIVTIKSKGKPLRSETLTPEGGGK